MNIPTWVWWVTILATVAFLILDIFYIGRDPHEPSLGESARHLAVYIGGALLFGVGVALFADPGHGGAFLAGWLTEYSLSVDNLFVFLVIMSSLRVPRHYQQTALLVGIVLALAMRGVFIAAGAALIAQFSWVFYLFGAFLVYTAVRVGTQAPESAHDAHPPDNAFRSENAAFRLARRWLPTTDGYRGVKVLVRESGRWLVTPMGLVILALGTTDLVFAMDSIPAIYGLTREPYLVLTANLFALMGLRQLYFLIGGLMQRLVYLNIGLSVLLGFIGVKLILEALHDNEVGFIHGGEPVPWAPAIPVWLSLVVIVGILGITAGASLLADGRRRQAPAPGLPPAV